MDRLKLILTFIILIGCIVGGLYWVSKNAEEEKKVRIATVEEGFTYSKGIITRWHSYKGHTFAIKYKIAGKEYEYIEGRDMNPRKLGVEDSIVFKYALKDPNMIITELEDAFY
jgi:hypothetical protein